MRFDLVLGERSSQVEQFEAVKGLVASFLDGTNNTIFAYGQTGTGKTFTMIGPCVNEEADLRGEDRGVLPRAIEMVMLQVERDPRTEILLSFYEIYNERVYDLFSES
jgi:kinesin family member 5